MVLGLSGIRSKGDRLARACVVAWASGVSLLVPAGTDVAPGRLVTLGLDLVALSGSGVAVPRFVSRTGLVGSGSSMGVAGRLIEGVSWFVGLFD